VIVLGEKAYYRERLCSLPQPFATILDPFESREIGTFDDRSDPAIMIPGDALWTSSLVVTSFEVLTSSPRSVSRARIAGAPVVPLLKRCADERFALYTLCKSLDDLHHHALDSEVVTPDWCKVPVTVDSNGIIRVLINTVVAQ